MVADKFRSVQKIMKPILKKFCKTDTQTETHPLMLKFLRNLKIIMNVDNMCGYKYVEQNHNVSISSVLHMHSHVPLSDFDVAQLKRGNENFPNVDACPLILLEPSQTRRWSSLKPSVMVVDNNNKTTCQY